MLLAQPSQQTEPQPPRPPAVVEALIARLQALCAHTRGDLFTVTPPEGTVDAARAEIDAGEDPAGVVAGCNADVCAELLKLWLRWVAIHDPKLAHQPGCFA